MPDRVLILKLGSLEGKRPGGLPEFVGWVRSALGADPLPIEVLDARSGPLPEPGPGDVVVTTGGRGSTYDREPWSEHAAAWLRSAVERGLPVLAICYGHQLLAQALGGGVALNPRGPEHGTFDVERLIDDPLFDGLLDVFAVRQTHFDAVVLPPPGAAILATSDRTAIQALALSERVRSVQWHPESIAQDGQGPFPSPIERGHLLRNFLHHFAGVAAG
jgi:GMP synthase (glutamine-hydrolysing)